MSLYVSMYGGARYVVWVASGEGRAAAQKDVGTTALNSTISVNVEKNKETKGKKNPKKILCFMCIHKEQDCSVYVCVCMFVFVHVIEEEGELECV